MTTETVNSGWIIFAASLLILGATIAWTPTRAAWERLTSYIAELVLIHRMTQENRRLMARVDSLRLSIDEEERKWNVWVEQALRQLPADNVVQFPSQRKAGDAS